MSPSHDAPMSLTLKSSQSQEFSNPHVYPSSQRDPSSFYLSPPKSSDSLSFASESSTDMMSTPHRGLPPPSSMERYDRVDRIDRVDRMDRMDRVLPQPQSDRGPPANGLSGGLPSAPSQWTGQDESMRSWLQAKSEEDRRKQEEEKTQQERLRLEQRKIEQKMLSESLQGGIPPPMVPMVFASMGGANLSNMSVEWAQQYMHQMSIQNHQQQAALQQQQQQQLQQQSQQHHQQQPQIAPSPDHRRDTRLLTGPNPNPYGTQQMQPPQSANPAAVPNYQGTNLAADRTRPQASLQAASAASTPRMSNQGSLSRLNTGELQVQAPAAGLQGLQISGQHPLQQTQNAQAQDQTSSPLYFHHYVPPTSNAKDKEGTPSAKKTSPQTQAPHSHMRSDYPPSPKKRKATGDHKAPPEPSPSFSHHSSSSSQRRRRSRQPSDASNRGTNEHPRKRTDSGRQSFSEAESGRNSAQPETRHRHPAGMDGREMRQDSRNSSDHSSPKREI